MNDDHPTRIRILSIAAACERLDCSRSWYYDRCNRKSPRFDPKLPQPVHHGARSGVIEYEIDDYIRGLMQARGGAADR